LEWVKESKCNLKSSYKDLFWFLHLKFKIRVVFRNLIGKLQKLQQVIEDGIKNVGPEMPTNN
jgi:hypothetical protein